MSLSPLSLFRASRAQTFESRRRSHQEWGRGMAVEEYLERDAITDQADVGRDGRLTTWVLAPRDDSQTLNFMCSCETFRREGVVARRQSSEIVREPEGVPCYAIASVFTPQAYRGNGYARHMMRLLHWVLAPEVSLPQTFPAEWGAPPARWQEFGNAKFSVLYSDVGDDFYSVCGPSAKPHDGWIVSEHLSTIWDVTDISIALGSHPNDPGLQYEWLDTDSLNDVWKLDSNMMKADLRNADLSSEHTLFTFLPESGVAEFQYQRMRFFIDKVDPRPKYFGLSLVSKSSALLNDQPPLPKPLAPPHPLPYDIRTNNNLIFASWTVEIHPQTPKTLIFTRLRSPKQYFNSLLLAVAGYCTKYGIERIEAWALPSQLRDDATALGGKLFKREEHLPSLKWYEAEGKHINGVRWMNNEKFAWC